MSLGLEFQTTQHRKGKEAVKTNVASKAPDQAANGAFAFMDGLTPRRSAMPLHVHHREDETVYVLEGEYEIAAGGCTVRAVAGSTVHLPKGVPHSLESVGTTPGRTLALLASAAGRSASSPSSGERSIYAQLA